MANLGNYPMIYTNSIEKIIKKAKKTNICILVPPRHYYWGTLEVVIKDPDGLILVFIAPYSKIEAEKLKADQIYAKQSK